jgi:hypothetical protein
VTNTPDQMAPEEIPVVLEESEEDRERMRKLDERIEAGGVSSRPSPTRRRAAASAPPRR